MSNTHIVFLKVSQISNNSNPDQQRRCSQENTAYVITSKTLKKRRKSQRYEVVYKKYKLLYRIYKKQHNIRINLTFKVV